MAVTAIAGSDKALDGLISTDSDERIAALQGSAKKLESNMKDEFKKLNDKNLSEADKQEVLWKIQQMQNLMERITSLISNMLESAHRTMMSVIQKIGS